MTYQSMRMGLQHQVIYLLMLCIHCGLTQNVTDPPTSQAISKSDTLLSGFYNTSGNSSSSNDTSNEAYSGLSSGNSITLHDFSVSRVNETTSKENSSTIQQDLQMLSDVFTSEFNSTEDMQKDMVNEKLNVNSSLGETNYINMSTAIKMNSIPNAVNIIHENVSQMQITTSAFNDVNSSWEEDRGTDMFLQAPNNEVKETSIPNNISVFTSNETVFDVPSVPFVTYNESAAERLIPTPDNSVQKQQDISNITENRNAPVDINITVANSTSDNNYELPEIKWRPGMRQPQTISDLIRVAGADIRFIATQFGSNFSVNGTEAHPLNANDTKTIPEQVKIIGSINDAITKLQDRHGLELGHESSSPMHNDGFINDNNFETPQLSNVKVSGPIVLPSRQISIDGDSSNSDTNNLRTMKSDGAPSKLTQVADGFMATNTLDNIIPNVVVRNSDDADSSRISYVPIIESRTANFPDLSTDEFGQNSDISGPSGGNGWINPTGQSETDSRRLISFGNNPEYVIGTGNSVQIPQSLIINHIPNGDTLEREGNRRNGNALFLRINRGSTERR
ncbi:uncharacterized protein LOC132741137 [Ruditapes philippinarum]|uniref:uncharacterized protein LOC132741137 n=1 Tax=Ruditapes philippinarum TaxID=129788 RepID=UPI00295C07EB|nr:uncharacterized protein LOC132741137 [Ruditapes philippinarum]